MGSIIAIIVVLVTGFYLLKRSVQEDKERQKLAQEEKQKPNADLVKDAQVMSQKAEALIQADIVGDRFIADAINGGTYTGVLPERRSDGCWLSIYENLRILKVAGINHRPDIERYVGRVECALVPEPKNEYDPYAIKIVAEDSHHIGYIPSNQTDLVRSLAANEFPYHCTAFIRECRDNVDGHNFFVGSVYIKRLD
ncbi:MAG: hypothetical protein IKQ53_06465 [Bacteroidales bacterium]|nr:hypothetical protein [Bacteroidales bacterium]